MAELTTSGELLYGKVLTPAGLIEEGVLAVSDGLIRYAGAAKWLPAAYAGWSSDHADKNCLLVPGFIDVHVHGGVGYDFMLCDREGLEAVTRFHCANGTTTLLATTMTATKEAIDRVLEEVDRFRSGPMPYAAIAGVHLEGPFISPKWPGAQNPDHIVPPDIAWLEEWEQRYPGLIRQVTLAPETDGALEAITWLRRRSITAALGHTDATYEQVIAAAEAGLNQAVHLFNAMTPLHHRKPGTAGAVLSDRRIRAEIIADGIHVHPAAIGLAARLKDADNLLLITDAMSAAGLGDGEYMLGDLPVAVRGGVATLRDNPDALAGSTLTMIRGFRFLVQEVGFTLEQASRAASYVPALSLGLERVTGTLEAGKRADILRLSPELELLEVRVEGRRISE